MYFRCSSPNRNPGPRFLPRDNGLKRILHLEHTTASREMLSQHTSRRGSGPPLAGALRRSRSRVQGTTSALAVAQQLKAQQERTVAQLLRATHAARAALFPASSGRTGLRRHPTSVRRVSHSHRRKQMGGSASTELKYLLLGHNRLLSVLTIRHTHTDSGNQSGYDTGSPSASRRSDQLTPPHSAFDPVPLADRTQHSALLRF